MCICTYSSYNLFITNPYYCTCVRSLCNLVILLVCAIDHESNIM